MLINPKCEINSHLGLHLHQALHFFARRITAPKHARKAIRVAKYGQHFSITQTGIQVSLQAPNRSVGTKSKCNPLPCQLFLRAI